MISKHECTVRKEFTLKIDIHSIKINVEKADQLQIIWKRKKISLEPPPFDYVSSWTDIKVNKSYELCQIGIYGYDKNVCEKVIRFDVLVIFKNIKYKIGCGTVKYSQIAETGTPIINEIIQIENTVDPDAYINISANLLSIIEVPKVKLIIKEHDILSRFTLSTTGSFDDIRPKPYEIHHQQFKDLLKKRIRFYSDDPIFNVSESSSSDEEVIEIKQSPRRTMSEVHPNQQSKATNLKDKEENAGLSHRRADRCANCIIY